jgi:hypothetical protein
MKANDILGLKEFRFIEPTFNVLPDESFTAMLLSEEATGARLVLDEEEWPVALAVRHDGSWKATSFILRPPVVEVVERFEELGGDIARTTQEQWMRAVREYYSIDLMKNNSPGMEDYSKERAANVKALLEEVWGGRTGDTCLDCGCGSGMGAAMLREAGLNSLAYDNDPTLLSLGLNKSRLRPEETMWIDATLARHYVRPCELGLVLMAGSITDFSAPVWKLILREMFELTEETLITVGTVEESEMVKLWSLGEGKKVKIFENDRDPFYDRWACLITD